MRRPHIDHGIKALKKLGATPRGWMRAADLALHVDAHRVGQFYQATPQAEAALDKLESIGLIQRRKARYQLTQAGAFVLSMTKRERKQALARTRKKASRAK